MTDFLVILLVLLMTAVAVVLLWMSAYPAIAIGVGVVGLVVCIIVSRA